MLGVAVRNVPQPSEAPQEWFRRGFLIPASRRAVRLRRSVAVQAREPSVAVLPLADMKASGDLSMKPAEFVRSDVHHLP